MTMKNPRHPRLRRLLAGLAAGALLAVGVAACDDDGGGGQESANKGTKTDQAFLKAMIPHHESAVEMANVAKQRGQHSEVKKLAVAIVATQSDEIQQMERIHKRLFRTEITPDPEAHEQLGLSLEEAGMAHMDGAEMLETARPFDRAFIDEMVPHHQGAIRMARAVKEETEDAEIKRLADSIIAAQSREIRGMNDWRTRWYDGPSPAGGVPHHAEPSDSIEEDEGGGMEEH